MTDRAALEERRIADPGFPIRHHLTRETDR